MYRYCMLYYIEALFRNIDSNALSGRPGESFLIMCSIVFIFRRVPLECVS